MYESYKPLRNYLRQFSQIPALAVVYRFMQYLQFDASLPPEFDNPARHSKHKWEKGIFEWELETLAREIILNCPAAGAKLMDRWGKFAEAMNHVKRVENDAWGDGDHAPDILMELLRLAHRQFHWQQGFNEAQLARFFKLYDHPKIRPLIEAEFGMTTREFFQIGLVLVGSLSGSMIIRTPLNNQINMVPAETVATLLDRLSTDLPELQRQLREQQEYNVNWAYSFNPLWLHPLIRVADDVLIGPLPTLLLYRLTSGVYFDLVGRGDEFGKSIGPAFQDYTGEVVQAANERGSLTILAEAEYGSKQRRKDSADWIVEDGEATLFLECKASRMRLQGKIDLIAKENMEREIARLAAFVTQLYATLADAISGQYEHWQFRGQPVYPVVVTLDEWHAFGTAEKIIDDAIDAAFAEKGLDKALLARFPYQVWSIGDFEHVIQPMAVRGIDDLMKAKTCPEKQHFPIHNYALDYAAKHEFAFKPLFPDPLERQHTK